MRKAMMVVFILIAGGMGPIMHLGMQSSFDLPKLALLVTGSLILSCLWFADQRSAMTIRKTPLDAPILGLGTIALLSAIFSWDKSMSFWGFYRIYSFGLLALSATALLYWITVQWRPNRSVMIHAIILSASVIALYGIAQFFGLELFARMPTVAQGRIWSSMGNPLFLASLLAMAIPLSVNEWLVTRRHRLLVATAICAIAMIGTLSRSAWIGCFAGLGVVAWTRLKTLNKGRFLIGAATVLALMMAWSPSRERFLSIFNSKESSNLARLEGWKGALRIAADHPLLGTGPDTFGTAFRQYKSKAYVLSAGAGMNQQHAHNDFLQWAATTGFLGVGMYLWLVSAFLWFGWKTVVKSPTPESCGLYAGCVALLVQNQFNFASVTAMAWAALFAALLWDGETKTISIPKPVRWSIGFAILSVTFAGLFITRQFLSADLLFYHAKGWQPNNRFDLAVPELEATVRLNPRVPEYRIALINAYKSRALQLNTGEAKRDLLEKAKNVMQEGLALHPHNVDMLNNLGVTCMWLTQLAGQDHFQEAVQLFERSINTDPTFSETWLYLAMVHEIAGQSQEAKTYWQAVLDLDPTNTMAKQVLGKTGSETQGRKS